MKRFHRYLPLLLLGCGVEGFSLSPLDPDNYVGPTVVASMPGPGSFGVPVDYPLIITFSTPIRAASLFGGIGVSGSEGAVPVTYSVAPDRKTVSVHASWPADQRLVLTADANVTDLRGRGLRDQDSHDEERDTPFALAFTTGSDATAAPPRVTQFDPPGGSTGVPVAVFPAVTFSKQMHPALPITVLLGPSGAVPHTAVWERGQTRLRIRPQAPLFEDTLFALRVEFARDAWGHALAGAASTHFATRKGGGRVLINEVVTSPLQDWGETAPGDGLPFNAVPGSGSVTASDEWIELFNDSGAAIDLTGWTLEMLDGSNQTHSFGVPSTAIELFTPPSATLQHFEAGAYLVVGNPAGDNSDTVLLILRDRYGLERDRVALGNGAPRGGGDTTSEEAIARIPNGADTGDDAIDWRPAKATPGGPN